MLEVIAICEKCKKSIHDFEGFLGVSYRNIGLAKRDRQVALSTALNARLIRLDRDEHWAAFVASKPSVRWVVGHYHCAYPEEPYHRRGYTFDVAMIQTRADLIAMTNRLARMDWFFETDWHILLAEAVKCTGRRLFVMPSAEELDAAFHDLHAAEL